MVRIRSVGVLSCAKIFAVVQGAVGILVSFFLVIVGAIAMAAAPAQQKFGMLGLIVMAALAPVFYAGIGFVIGMIWGVVYNWVAHTLGGIELELEAVSVTRYPDPAPAPAAS